MNLTRITAVVAAAACLFGAERAEAFCGFYVNGAGSDLYNNATQVVLMRDGTTTVVSMQNNYQGPPKDFALVVPVPVVLQKADVKTLPREVFDKVDTLGAPRLVEYWEQDPCTPINRYGTIGRGSGTGTGYGMGAGGARRKHGVKVEAQFTVGEYQIVILSATESTGLETWLVEEGYKIPAGAAAHLKPYVEQGSKFFVAKVDVAKVKMKDGMAQLSPLRFHYPSDDLRLPIRLGLLNARDKQDLIVHVLGRGRYRLANYPNAFIPTNLDVTDATRERFGEFYAALFDATLEKNPGAAITEYAWDSSSCDPCPGNGSVLLRRELATLGLDALGQDTTSSRRAVRGWVLTRLHMRYGPGDVKDDLVFEKADPVVGGREILRDGGLEQGAKPFSRNFFQARYAIRHPWTGPIECDEPVRGRWGGPPGGEKKAPTRAARDLAFAPRGKAGLSTFVSGAVPGLGAGAGAVTAAQSAPPPSSAPPAQAPEPANKGEKSKGCTVAADRGTPPGVTLWVALAAFAAVRRRRD